MYITLSFWKFLRNVQYFSLYEETTKLWSFWLGIQMKWNCSNVISQTLNLLTLYTAWMYKYTVLYALRASVVTQTQFPNTKILMSILYIGETCFYSLLQPLVTGSHCGMLTDVHVYLCTYATLISTKTQHCHCKPSLIRNTCLRDQYLSAFDNQMSHSDSKQWQFLSVSIGALKWIMLVSVSVSVNQLKGQGCQWSVGMTC